MLRFTLKELLNKWTGMVMMDDKSTDFRYGQTNPDTGLVCLGKAKNCKDGLRWCTPEKFIERKSAISEWSKRANVREHTKTLRNTDQERSKRNSYSRNKRSENPKFRGKNIEGMVFGRLTAISIAGVKDYNGDGKRLWLCKCSCGNTTEVSTGNLLKEFGTKSCGCLHKETSAENGRKSRPKVMKPEAQLNSVRGIYKSNAVKRGLVWRLSDEQARILFENSCHYCGTPPSNTYVARSYTRKYSGIDRLDNALGYTTENTVSCCSICNHAKHTMGRDAFESWAIRVARHILERAIEEIDRTWDDGK